MGLEGINIVSLKKLVSVLRLTIWGCVAQNQLQRRKTELSWDRGTLQGQASKVACLGKLRRSQRHCREKGFKKRRNKLKFLYLPIVNLSLLCPYQMFYIIDVIKKLFLQYSQFLLKFLSASLA